MRRMWRRDFDAVVRLFDAYRMFYGRPSDVHAARRFLKQRCTRGESTILVAELGSAGTIVGFAQLYRTFSSLSMASVVLFNDLYVASEARGNGVATRLLDAAIGYARESGAVALQLATQHTNEPALALYRAKGFVPDREFVYMSLALAAP